MNPNIDKARAAMKRGASLAEAAVAGGFQFAADLDCALWEGLPGPEVREAPTVAKQGGATSGVDTETGRRFPTDRMTMIKTAVFARACEKAGLAPYEAQEARLISAKLKITLVDAIPYVLRSRKPAEAAR